VSIAAGVFHNQVLTADGRLISWGYGPVPPSDLSGVIAVAPSGSWALGIRANGEAIGWGDDNCGLTSAASALAHVVAVAANWDDAVALMADGTVTGWGCNQSGQLNVPLGLSHIVSVSAGAAHVLALSRGGHVVTWGGDWAGQTRRPDGLSNVVAIAAGWYHSVAVVADVPDCPEVRLLNPRFTSNNFEFSVPTHLDKTYLLESKVSLSGDWTFVRLLAGDGTSKEFVDQIGTNASRFYRVRRID
jgi:alpha-tubulin suppressor-like RCC1 family protein